MRQELKDEIERLEAKGIRETTTPAELEKKLGRSRRTYEKWPCWRVEQKGNRVYRTATITQVARYMIGG